MLRMGNVVCKKLHFSTIFVRMEGWFRHRVAGLITACLLVAPSMYAGRFLTVSHLNNDNESIQGKITDVIQDKDGYIWFGSFNGLHRYDGYSLVKYKSYAGDASLVSNRIHKIRENSRGDLWCIAAGRVYLFEKNVERFLDIQQVFETHSPANTQIIDFYPLANGYTWMISSQGECFRFDDTKPMNGFERVNHLFGRNIDVNRIYLDSLGQEWILSKKGLFRYGYNKAISKTPFYYLFERDKRLWLSATTGKMAYYDLSEQRLIDLELPLRAHRIHHQEYIGDSLLYTATDVGVLCTRLSNKQTRLLHSIELYHFRCDRNGSVWGTTRDYRIVRIDVHGQLRSIPLPDGVAFNDYRICFKEDAQGLLWLLFYDNSRILFFDEQTGCFELPEQANPIHTGLYGYLEDRQGNVWYRHANGLDRISLHNTPFEHSMSDPPAELRCTLTDEQGRLWTAYRDERIQLHTSDGKRLGNLTANGQIVTEDVRSGMLAYALLQDRKRRIWIGTKAQGLYVLTPTSDPEKYAIRHYAPQTNNPYSLSHPSVYSIFEDSGGHIWIGTLGGGLNLWDEGRFIHAGNDLGASADVKPENVRYLCEPEPGIVAVCSKEGLFAFETAFDHPGQVRFYCNTKTGQPKALSESDVMYLYKSRDGQIYLCTNSGGLSCIESGLLLSENMGFRTMSKSDGLASDVVLSAIEDSSGNLWLTGETALTRYTPATGATHIFDAGYFGSAIRFSEGKPFEYQGKLCFGSTTGCVLFSPEDIQTNSYVPPLVFSSLYIHNNPAFERIDSTGSVYLHSNERNIRLSFAALDYRSGNARIQYAYRLEGIDHDWNYTRENSISYLNIPKGKHLFHLRSTNGDGVWVDNEKILHLYVSPRFFESYPGYSILFLLTLLVFWVVFLAYRRFYKLRHRLAMEEELTDIKLRFFTDISHELRTPLTLITGPVEAVLEEQQLSEQSRKYLILVQKNSKRMLQLVNQILDFRKLQHNKMHLLLQYVDVRQHLERIMADFSLLAQQHNIRFELLVDDVPSPYLWLDVDKFEKICFNLFSNAFKYTPDGKTIQLILSYHGSAIHLSVVDQGVGISEDRLDEVFKRFETVMKSNLFKASSGIGLALVKQFVELHHGSIHVSSRPGEGSRFTIHFLCGKDHFLNDSVEYLVTDAPNPTASIDPTTEPLLDTLHDPAEERNRILVVDDNDEVRGFIRDVLSTQYEIILAADGQEALEAGKTSWPDLIISDVMMPRMDGYVLLEHVKSDPDLYAVPIILLTAKTSLDDRIQGTELGADDYISKPFSANYLKAKVAALIEQRRQLKFRLLESLSLQDSNVLQRNKTSLTHISQADKQFIEKILQFTESRLDDSTLSLSDFTDHMNMGRSAFANKFKALLGVSPMDFVLDMRMKRAGQLLQNQDLTVSEIAYQTGFNNPKYFSTCFRRFYGVSPSGFKKRG